MSEQISVKADVFHGLQERNVQLHQQLQKWQKTAQSLDGNLHEIAQERDAALARVVELEDAILQGDYAFHDMVLSNRNVWLHTQLKQKDAQVDSLASDVQAARLASSLAAKERDALRQLVIEQREIIRELYSLYPATSIRARYKDVEQRAAALLVRMEEPK